MIECIILGGALVARLNSCITATDVHMAISRTYHKIIRGTEEFRVCIQLLSIVHIVYCDTITWIWVGLMDHAGLEITVFILI